MLSGMWAKECLKANKSLWRPPGKLGSKKKVQSSSVMKNVMADKVKLKSTVGGNSPNPWTMAVFPRMFLSKPRNRVTLNQQPGKCLLASPSVLSMDNSRLRGASHARSHLQFPKTNIQVDIFWCFGHLSLALWLLPHSPFYISDLWTWQIHTSLAFCPCCSFYLETLPASDAHMAVGGWLLHASHSHS